MKNFSKKLLGLALVGMMLIGAMAGCSKGDEPKDEVAKDDTAAVSDDAAKDNSSDKKFKIGFSNAADSDTFDLIRTHAFRDENIAKGNMYDIIFTDADMNNEKQLGDIDTFINEKVDAIILIPVDGDGVIPGIEKANAAGIPVMCLGISANGGDNIYVGSENYDAGKMQADYMVKELPENAKILYLAGQEGYQHTIDRHDAVIDTITKERPDVEILDVQSGEYYQDKAQEKVDAWVQSFPEINAIIAANDMMAMGAIESLKAANRLDGVLISGIDGVDVALQAIKEDEMAQSVFQNAPAQAIAAFATLEKVFNGEKIEGDKVIVPFENITKDNVEKYMN